MFLSLMFEHDAMPCTAVSHSAGCEISKTPANLPSRGSKVTGLFLVFCTAVECEFSKLYFLLQLVLFLLYTFVNILNLERPCILSRGNLAAAGGTLRKGKLLHFTSEPRPLAPSTKFSTIPYSQLRF